MPDSELVSPELTQIPLPILTERVPSQPPPTRVIVSSRLSASECASLIHTHSLSTDDANMHTVSGTYTSRLRCVVEDPELAETLWTRLEKFYGGMKVVDEEGQSWSAVALNTCFRFCKYRAGKLPLVSSAVLFFFSQAGSRRRPVARHMLLFPPRIVCQYLTIPSHRRWIRPTC